MPGAHPYDAAFQPDPDDDSREADDYWAWYDHEESKRKDY